MAETLEIDPVSEAATNVVLTLTDHGNGIALKNDPPPSYPDPPRKRQWASSQDTEGALLSAAQFENREITMTAQCFGANMRTRIKELQQKIGKLQREGGTLKRTLDDATVITFDVLDAGMELSSDFLFVNRDYAEAALTFICKPFGRGTEYQGDDNVETTLPCLILTVPDVPGDVPALCTLTVDEDDAEDQWFLFWGRESLNYNAGTTHKLFYEAETLQRLGGATLTTPTGASGGTAVIHGTLTTTYQPVLSTNYAAGTVAQQHIGDFNVWARAIYQNTSGTVSVALEWAQGDFGRTTLNDPVVFTPGDPREGWWSLVNLGPVHLKKAAQGDQRWEGRILAKTTEGFVGDDFVVDCLFLQPITEGWGEVRARPQFENPSTLNARDEFDQTVTGGSDPLAGLTLPVGGTWAGAGDADDFVVEDTNSTAQRTAVSDAANTGRFALAGTATFTATLVQVDLKVPDSSATAGLVARYTSTTSALVCRISGSPNSRTINVMANTGSGWSSAGYAQITDTTAAINPDAWYTARLVILANGRFLVWVSPRGVTPTAPVASGFNSALATGGALASGRVGFYDERTVATAGTRNYDNFLAAVPTSNAAAFASQSLQLRHDRVIREDSTGSFWAPVPSYEGDYMKLMPAGREDRTNRLILATWRGDPDTMSSAVAGDDISARATITPRYLHVPQP